MSQRRFLEAQLILFFSNIPLTPQLSTHPTAQGVGSKRWLAISFINPNF